MTYTIAPGSKRSGAAGAFGREMVRALQVRGIPRSELHRVTGIGRTTLDNYRTGSTLPRTEAAATIAQVLEWPKLLEIVRQARSRPCERCRRSFTFEAGSGVKRYCSTSCRELAARERLASHRLRKAGQTDDARQTRAAVQRLRSGIRIAEERTAELAAAIEAMCADCEPQGVCRTPLCPLRSHSPLPLASHDVDQPRTMAEIRVELDRKAGPKRSAAMVARHAEGRMSYLPKGDPRHPANDPARREQWLERQRAGHKNRPRRSLTPEHRAAIAAGHARRREARLSV